MGKEEETEKREEEKKGQREETEIVSWKTKLILVLRMGHGNNKTKIVKTNITDYLRCSRNKGKCKQYSKK